MKQEYNDIMDKLGPPLWWDEVGCPRYKKFHPGLANNIYANEACLLLISCQNCGTKFKVCLTDKHGSYITVISDRIKNKTVHYGDPPNIGCCLSGPSMNCDDIKVIEFWGKDKNYNWKRSRKFEILLS